ncbi:hypothetical protein MNBD_BACTEROID05-291 [hydrothermal vent metagenome]|uniref:Short-chain dehydrogenase/reductase (SDR) superfamily n=1 Tax=hydrothermal vent metagenome TaxID=652676 RepID=A0A3B0SZ06_9ZZZZ
MKTVLITGTNRGIGLEMCRQLKNKGYSVTAVCRQASENLKELEIEIIEGIDVGQNDVIEKLKASLGNQRKFDVLINNAGILRGDNLEELDFKSIEDQFQVNALGPLRVTQAILPTLSEGSKILMITSRMGSVADNTSGRMYGYRMSKSALNMGSVSLAYDLKDRGIAVGIVHPGYVKTDMTNHSGHIETDESVRGILDRLDELTLANSGTFWHSNGEKLLW